MDKKLTNTDHHDYYIELKDEGEERRQNKENQSLIARTENEELILPGPPKSEDIPKGGIKMSTIPEKKEIKNLSNQVRTVILCRKVQR